MKQFHKKLHKQCVRKNMEKEFIKEKVFSLRTIQEFSDAIDRDPGIVLGRLQNDGLVGYDDWTLQSLRHKYKVKISF